MLHSADRVREGHRDSPTVYNTTLSAHFKASGSGLRVCREENLDQWLQPPPLGGDAVRVPRLDRRLEARALRVGELEHPRRQIESAGFHTTRSWPPTISRFSSSAFPRQHQARSVLYRPDRANGSHVRPLCAQERVQVQTLGVVQCQFHRFFLSGLRVGVEQDVASRRSGRRLHFQNARPSGRIGGAHQFGEAVAVAGAARQN